MRTSPRRHDHLPTLACALATLLASGCAFIASPAPKPAPAEPAPAATATVTAAATADPAAAAPSASTAPAAEAPKEEPKPPKTFSLAEYKLPLVIDLPAEAKIAASESRDKLGGATVDDKKLSLRIMKADGRMGTIAAAKATLQKLVRPARNFLKEEPDLLVYDRGDNDISFLMLVKQGGVTYACQSLGGEKTEADLDPGLAACRSLKKAP